MMSMELQHIGARGVCVAPNGWDIHPLKYVSYSNRYVLPEATTDTLGGVKLSSNGSVSMDADGNMVISTTSDDDIAALFGN